MLPKLPGISTGYPELQLLADHLTQSARAINSCEVIAGNGISSTTVDGVGTVVSIDTKAQSLPFRMGVIVNAGPSGAADYTNNRYWIKDAYLHQASSPLDTDAADVREEDATNNNEPFTGTNLSEATDGTHALPVDGSVVVWYVRIRGRNTAGDSVDQVVFISGRVQGVLYEGTVTQTGGSAGDATTQCSFTYTVKDLAGVTLGTGKAPSCARPSIGKLVAGTKCRYYYNLVGVLVLSWVDEVPAVVKRVCP